MKIRIEVESTNSIVDLTPDQCTDLAKACYLASQESEQDASGDPELYRSFAVLFHAGSVAGHGQLDMSEAEVKSMMKQLAEKLNR